MRCTRPRVSGNPDDRFAIQLHREAGRQVVSDQDLVRSLREVDRIVIGQSKQDRKDPDVYVDQVTDPLAQERTRVSRELLAPLEQHEIEAFLSTEILVDQFLYLADKLAVLEYRQ